MSTFRRRLAFRLHRAWLDPWSLWHRLTRRHWPYWFRTGYDFLTWRYSCSICDPLNPDVPETEPARDRVLAGLLAESQADYVRRTIREMHRRLVLPPHEADSIDAAIGYALNDCVQRLLTALYASNQGVRGVMPMADTAVEPEPGDDAARRLYVLTRLVTIAYDEMPERLNNATRVNVNHAHAYARGGYSSGDTRDLEAEYDRLAASSGLAKEPLDAADPQTILGLLDRIAVLEGALRNLVNAAIAVKQAIPLRPLDVEWRPFLNRTGELNQRLDAAESALGATETEPGEGT